MSEKTKSQIIRESNVATFSPIMSKEDIITKLFSAGSKEDQKIAKSLADNPSYTEKLSDVLEAMTIEPVLTRDVIKKLYDLEKSQNNEEQVTRHAGEFIKIVHASDYFITKDSKNKDVNFSNTNFGIKKKSLKKEIFDGTAQQGYYRYSEKYGVFKNRKLKDTHFTLDNICNYTLDPNKPSENLQNNVTDNNLSTSRINTSLSFTLIDSPNLRIGTKNSLELSTFLNNLSTIELSKCLPYFNIEFVLPRLNKTAGGNTYETASITQFLKGTPNRDTNREDPTTGTYKSLSASFVREIDSKSRKIKQEAVKTNISAFTMPQTVNNFDEKYVGHTENKSDENEDFRRQNSIHDYTKPFMTIKDFSVDIAPTQGLMSFKTGRISLVLHDRTRMSEIAPFIKPDLYGSFGAELIITYGWSHIDGINKISGERGNFFGEFLDKSKITEKYIITNSSFTVDSAGQVNIDLNIAMRGPIDIRSNTIVVDSKEKLKQDHVKTFLETYNLEKERFDRLTKKYVTLDLSGLINKVKAEVQRYSSKDNKSENLMLVAHAGSPATIRRYKRAIKVIKRKTSNGDTTATIEDFHKAIKILYVKAGKDSKTADASLIRTVLKANTDKKVISSEQSGPPYPGNNVLNNVCVDINDIITTPRVHELLIDLLNALTSYFQSCYFTYYKHKKRGDNRSKKIVDSILGKVSDEDPFFNKDWVVRYYKTLGTTAQKKLVKDKVIPIDLKNGSVFKGKKYITLGTFITSLISTYMCGKGKFNEVQIISYTTNDNAGLMKNLNLASLLIPRDDLEEFLQDMFSSGTTMTIEGIISQVLNRFVMTSTQICYGFNELYKRENDVVKPRVEESELHKAGFNSRLENIYRTIAGLEDKEIKLSDVTFSMPKVKLLFDTLVSRRQEGETTICRISLIDQNDNPYKAVSEIMSGIYSNGIIKNSALLNKAKSKKNAHIKKSPNEKAIAEADFYRESQKIIMQMLGKSYDPKKKQYVKDPNLEPLIKEELNEQSKPTGRYEIIDKHKFNSSLLKNRIKSIMPSVTYGTQNSAVIDASVTTINEAKLNTVYLTRADRNGDSSKRQIEAQVKFQEDMPLRVLPSQASLTIFGCPFVNFAQYIFLDFETGTSIDNQYAITGIKHDFAPGKFTTSLTLSYGDIYGKYEAALDTLTKALSDKYENRLQQVIKEEKEELKRKQELEAKIRANKARLELGISSNLGQSAIAIVDKVDNIITSELDYRTPADILGVNDTNKKYRSSIATKFVKVAYPYENRKHTLIEIAADITKDIYEHMHQQYPELNNTEELKKVYQVTSGFRDIKTQQTIWNNGIIKYKKQIIDAAKLQGIKEADIPNLDAQAAFTAWRWIALPGDSNHQEGFTFDLKMHPTLSNSSQYRNDLKNSSTYKKFTDKSQNPYFEFLKGISDEAWHWIFDIEGQIAYLKYKGTHTENKETILRALNKATKDQLSILRQANIKYKNKVLDALKAANLPGGKLTMQGMWTPKKDSNGKVIKKDGKVVLEYKFGTSYQTRYKSQQSYRPRLKNTKVVNYNKGQSKAKKEPQKETEIVKKVITDISPMKLKLNDDHITNSEVFFDMTRAEIDVVSDINKSNVLYSLLNKYASIEVKTFKFSENTAFYTFDKSKKKLTLFIGYRKNNDNTIFLNFLDDSATVKNKIKLDLEELACPKYLIDFLDAIKSYEEQNGEIIADSTVKEFLEFTFTNNVNEEKINKIKDFFQNIEKYHKKNVSKILDLDEIDNLLSQDDFFEVENLINAAYADSNNFFVLNSDLAFSEIQDYGSILVDEDIIVENIVSGQSMFDIGINLKNYNDKQTIEKRKDFFNQLIPLMFDFTMKVELLHNSANSGGVSILDPELSFEIKQEDALYKNGSKIKEVLENHKNEKFFNDLEKQLKVRNLDNYSLQYATLSAAGKKIIENVSFTNESIKFTVVDMATVEKEPDGEVFKYKSHKTIESNFDYYSLASQIIDIIHDSTITIG